MSYIPPRKAPTIIIKNKKLRKALDVLNTIIIIIFFILLFLGAVYGLACFIADLQEFCNAIANDLTAIIT